jgi:hypothetical protein
MKTFLRVLKFAACLFGGVVAASLVFVSVTVAAFGLHGGNHLFGVIDRWIPFVWIFGAAFGAWAAYVSERSPRA